MKERICETDASVDLLVARRTNNRKVVGSMKVIVLWLCHATI